MDSRLIFLHYRNSIKTEGGTRTQALEAQWFQFHGGEEIRIGKSAGSSARKSL